MRTASLKRQTKETDVSVTLNLDGKGEADIWTGVGFFDHMLTALCVHGGFDLSVSVSGDLNVDCHHTVEDTGIVLGQALKEALKDSGPICRYGWFLPAISRPTKSATWIPRWWRNLCGPLLFRRESPST